jgi:hypothetical protein
MGGVDDGVDLLAFEEFNQPVDTAEPADPDWAGQRPPAR